VRERHNVISTQPSGERTIVHVLADKDPGEGFRPAPSHLEHVYFATLNRSKRAA
jgi:ABC-2 type transport system ATP-binding protein